MKTIAVTGGKGGTGKSTVAIAIAFKEIQNGKKVLLVDCDVECPNDYILLGTGGPENPAKKTYTYYPKILVEKCTRCGLCVKKCRSKALFQTSGNTPTLNESLCNSCGLCWSICPQGAIQKERRVNGEIFENQIDENLTLVTGRSIPGVRETSPVVRQVREYVKTKGESYDLVIIDTAAGTHCTVMSALEGVDKAFAVTEPTPLGAHDLNLILGVLKVLKVPSEIVLNRSDIGDSDIIGKIARDRDVDISFKIPYSKKLARIYSEGKLYENKDLVNLVKLP